MKTAQSSSLSQPEKDIQSVLDRIETIRKTGFGEVRIIIKNGAIHRILTTEDEIVQKE
jgi:hypothetical protein